MNGGLYYSPRANIFVNGSIVPKGSIEFFVNGSLVTQKAVYSDAGLTASLGSVVFANAAGDLVNGSGNTTAVYLAGGKYTIRVRAAGTAGVANGAVLYTQDNVMGNPDAEDISYTTPYTGAVEQSLEDWLKQKGLSPEDFGAATTFNQSVDDTSYVNACVSACLLQGRPMWLQRKYTTTGTTIAATDVTKRGLFIGGTGGAEFKREDYAAACGFTAFQNNQAFVLRFSDRAAAGNSDMINVTMQNVLVDGNGFTLTKGIVECEALSQAKFLNCSFINAVSPAFVARFLEDANFINCNFGRCGASNGRPAFCFSSVSNSDFEAIGSNAVNFVSCRFEFVDGPLVGTEPNDAYTWVSTISFNGMCKFENGVFEQYGSNRANYYMMDFRDGQQGRKVVMVNDGHFSICDTGNTLGLFAVGGCDQFIVDNYQASIGSGTINILKVANRDNSKAEGRIIRIGSGSVRVANVTGSGDSITVAAPSVSNEFPIHFEYPLHERGFSLAEMHNDGVNRVLSAVRYGYPAEGNSEMVIDPDPSTDPCLSNPALVKSVVGANGNALFIFGHNGTGLGTAGYTGYHEKLPFRAKVWVRVKKAGNAAAATIRLVTGPIGSSTNLQTIALSNTTWSWVSFDPVLLSATANLRVSGISTNQADHTIYLDAGYIEYVQNASTFEAQDYGAVSTSRTIPAANAGQPVRIYTINDTSAGGNEIQTIAQGSFAGQELILKSANTSTQTVLLKNSAGSPNFISIGSDFTIPIGRGIRLIFDGTNWTFAG
jgi:hypothetical protein